MRVLGLVNAKVSQTSMQDIGVIVAESVSLRELDISWNILKPESYNTLIQSIGENRTLLTLNLSWNRIVESTETIIEEPLPLSVLMPGTTVNSPHGSQNGSLRTEPEEILWFDKQVQFTESS